MAIRSVSYIQFITSLPNDSSPCSSCKDGLCQKQEEHRQKFCRTPQKLSCNRALSYNKRWGEEFRKEVNSNKRGLIVIWL